MILSNVYLIILFLSLCIPFHYTYAMEQPIIEHESNLQLHTPDTLKHLCFDFFANQHYKKYGIQSDFSKALNPETCTQDLHENFMNWFAYSQYGLKQKFSNNSSNNQSPYKLAVFLQTPRKIVEKIL